MRQILKYHSYAQYLHTCKIICMVDSWRHAALVLAKEKKCVRALHSPVST